MGRDIISSVKVDYEKLVIENPDIDSLFNAAADLVIEKAGSYDGGLRLGGLDCSTSIRMLEKAVGLSLSHEHYHIATQLQMMSNWDFEYSDEDAWAYWSARKFMECCCEFDLYFKLT